MVERGGVRFGIVSVLDPAQRIITMTARDQEEYDGGPIPVATLRELVPRVREETDTIILLGHLGDAKYQIGRARSQRASMSAWWATAIAMSPPSVLSATPSCSVRPTRAATWGGRICSFARPTAG